MGSGGCRMSSILIASVPFNGHVTPLLTVAEGFVRRGDDVRFLTGARFADRVRATGASFVPLPADADFDETTIVADLPERAHLKGTKALAFDFDRVFVRPATSQYHALAEAISARHTDVVLTDP